MHGRINKSRCAERHPTRPGRNVHSAACDARLLAARSTGKQTKVGRAVGADAAALRPLVAAGQVRRRRVAAPGHGVGRLTRVASGMSSSHADANRAITPRDYAVTPQSLSR